MAQRPIRFGLIGAGIAAETHARELLNVEGAGLRAIFARDGAKARLLGDRYGVMRTDDNIDRFLADPELDAVIVATPNGLHRDYAIAAASAGKHVVVEKPLEITGARARDIVEACRASSVRLFVIYQMRYSEAARKAKTDIDTGKLGRVVLVNVFDNEYRTPEYYSRDAWRGTRELEGGGCLITQTSHLLDLVQHLAGPVASVFAETATAFHAIETEDTAVATLRFASGALGTVSSATTAYPALRHLVTISGTDGSIAFNGEHDQIVFRRSRHDDEVIDMPKGFSFADPVDPRAFPTGRQRNQLQAISDAIADGLRLAEEDDPLRAVQLLDAIYKSAREGRAMSVTEAA